MKNLIQTKDLETLNDLPKKITGRKLHKLNHSWKSYGKSTYHSVDNVYPFKRIDRILEKFLGQHVNDAFSYYCKQVPLYQQKEFWEYLQRDLKYSWVFYFYNSEGIIIKKDKRVKRNYAIKSDDYTTELRHRVTGHKKTDFEKIFEQFKKVVKYGDKKQYESIYTINGDFLYYEYGAKKWREKPAYCRYIAYDSDFIPVIIQGYYKTFESDKDPRYVRHYAEKAKQIKKEHKLWKKKNKEESLEKLRLMYEKEKERREKEKQENLLKIIKHGFDPITSFRNEKQTNPDLIQLKQ